jgi:tetratricopeptide (TPR) repeat protein
VAVADERIYEARCKDRESVALAKVLSLAAVVEPALLRRARFLLPGATVAAEGNLWFGPLVEARGPSGLLLRSDVAEILRQDLIREDADLFERAWTLVRDAHATHPWSIRVEEEINRASVAMPEAERLAAIGGLLEFAQRKLEVGSHDARDVRRWIVRLEARLPSLTRKSAPLRRLVDGLRLRAVGRLGAPSEVSPAQYDWLRTRLPPDLPRTNIGLRLSRGSLEAGPTNLPGSAVIAVPATRPIGLQVFWRDQHGPTEARLWFHQGETGTISVGSPTVEVRTLAGTRWELCLRTPARDQRAGLILAHHPEFAAFARELRRQLRASGFTWRDEQEGAPQTRAAEDSIIVVVSSSALRSPTISAQLDDARRAGTRIILVVAGDVLTDSIPPWARHEGVFDLRGTGPDRNAAWNRLIRVLESPYERVLSPNNAPTPGESDIHGRYFEATDLLAQMHERRLGGRTSPLALCSGDMASDTTLASVVALLAQEMFPDGVLWIEQGESFAGSQPPITAAIGLLTAQSTSAESDPLAMSANLRRLLERRAVLLVLSGVSSGDWARSFTSAHFGGTLIVTADASRVEAMGAEVFAPRSGRREATLTDAERGRILVLLADAARSRGDWAAAVQFLRRLLSVLKDDGGKLPIMRSIFHLLVVRLGDAEGALALFHELRFDNPQVTSLVESLATYIDQAASDDVAGLLSELAGTVAGDARAQVLEMAAAHCRLYSQATSLLRDALRANPVRSSLLGGLAVRGSVVDQFDAFAEALELLQNVSSLEAEQARAKIWTFLDRNPKALEDSIPERLKKATMAARNLPPDVFAKYSVLARIHVANDELMHAVFCLHAAAAGNPSRVYAPPDGVTFEQIEAARRLFEIYRRRGDENGAFCCLMFFRRFGNMSQQEDARFRDVRSTTIGGSEGTISDSDWGEKIRHPYQHGALVRLMSTMSNGLSLQWSQPEHADSLPVEICQRILTAFGLPVPTIRMAADENAPAVAVSTVVRDGRMAPALDLGVQLARESHPGRLAFLLASCLTAFRPEHLASWIGRPDKQDASTLCLASLGLADKRRAEAQEGWSAAAAVHGWLTEHLSPRSKEELRDLVLELDWADLRAASRRWEDGLSCTSARMGLLACGDLEMALSFVGALGTTNDLRRWSVSRDHVELRNTLGLRVSPRGVLLQPST